MKFITSPENAQARQQQLPSLMRFKQKKQYVKKTCVCMPLSYNVVTRYNKIRAALSINSLRGADQLTTYETQTQLFWLLPMLSPSSGAVVPAEVVTPFAGALFKKSL